MLPPRHLTVSGVPEGLDARLLADEAAKGPVVLVARDDRRLAAAQAALAFFAPSLAVLTLPAWDCLPYDRVSPNPVVTAERLSTLAALAAGLKGPLVLLTSLNAAMQRLPARSIMAGASFRAD